MNRKSFHIALISVLVGCSAVEAAAGEYCTKGSGAIELKPAPIPRGEVITEILQDCKPGDIMAIPSAEIFIAANICDFSKTIVATPGINTKLLCVLKADAAKK